MGVLEWIGAALPHLDYFFPNDEQVLGFTGAGGPRSRRAGRSSERGVGCVAATCGGDGGAGRRRADDAVQVPALDIDVVDTTGCGDAFAAGFLRGVSLGREPEAAAQSAARQRRRSRGGLGSDYGDFDLSSLGKP